MEDKTVTVPGGLSIGSTTFLVFLVLRLTGVIDWSWWWITSPLWIPLILAGLLVAIIVMVDRGA